MLFATLSSALMFAYVVWITLQKRSHWSLVRSTLTAVHSRIKYISLSELLNIIKVILRIRYHLVKNKSPKCGRYLYEQNRTYL